MGTMGQRMASFIHPSGVAVDTSGNVYVADSGNNRIQKFDSNGTYITQWGVGDGKWPVSCTHMEWQ